MFPAFFLEAMEPNSITIVGDESDDEAKAAAQEACGDSDNGTVVYTFALMAAIFWP